MTNYYKTPAAARKVGISYTRLIGLMRYDKVAPPERDTSGDFVWTDADLDRIRAALAISAPKKEDAIAS